MHIPIMPLRRFQNPWLPRCAAASFLCNQTGFRLNKPYIQASRRYSSVQGTIPRAAHPSIWQSIVPRAFRESRSDKAQAKPGKHKDWNPATFFIIIFLLIGSNAIQMIALRHDVLSFSRKAEAKIGLLKEVIERVHRGEDIDVEGLLGTGDEKKEREWEEVIREIEEADRNWDPSARRRKDRRASESREQPLISDQDEPETRTNLTGRELNGNAVDVPVPGLTQVTTKKEPTSGNFY